MSEPNYTITVMEERNFGDHGDIIPVSRETVSGETVEDLILRCHPKLSQLFTQHSASDHIVIRVTAESADRMAKAATEGLKRESV